ncbi:MAG: ABC transporter substrate-binding protein, partial [Myxococcota bacterium]
AALKVLKDPSLQGKKNRKSRWSQLRKVSDDAFDWSSMSQRSLGVHWRKLNASQRERFVTTFRELLASHYLGQIDRFTGKERLEFKGTGETPEGTEVKMVLMTASREKVPLHFFVDERPKVYDVSIEGVSIANHYRGVFNRQLTNGDFDSLMKKLERKIARKKKKQQR